MTSGNQIRWIALAIGIVALVATAFAIGRRTAGTDRAADVQTIAAQPDGSSQRQQWYTCSMHPQVRSLDPKEKCPICGMDLIPVPGDGDDEEDDDAVPRLRVSRRAAALMQVQVWPVQRLAVHREIRLYGVLDYDETRLRTIAARYPGRIDRLHVNFTGTAVTEGQPVAEMYSPALVTAQQELLQAAGAAQQYRENGGRLAAETAQLTLQAARDRLRLLGLTPPQIDEIETTRQVQDQLVIHAPVSGIVTQRHATEGVYVETGDPIYSIADLSQLWLNLQVYETDLQWLRLGQLATFTVQAYPGEEFTGELAFIDPVLDSRTRALRARVDVPNDDGRLRPGMFARGLIKADIGGLDDQPPLVIPATAPLITGQRAVVYVQVPNEDRPTFEARTIALGGRAGDHYIVHGGLIEGDLVVSNGAFKIDSELQIRGRPSMMAPKGGGPPTPHHEHGTVAPLASGAAGGMASREGKAKLESIEAPATFVNTLAPVYEHYLAAQTALAADNLTAFKAVAKRLHEAVDAIDSSQLGGDAAAAWTDISHRLLKDREHIDHLTDINATRALFETYAIAAMELAQQFGPADRNDLAIAYCPMAFDFRGASWLQAGNEIANPYFGASMLRCGEIRQQIQPRLEEGARP